MSDFGMVSLQLYTVHMDYEWELSRAFRSDDKVFYIDINISGTVAWDFYEDFLKNCIKAEVM